MQKVRKDSGGMPIPQIPFRDLPIDARIGRILDATDTESVFETGLRCLMSVDPLQAQAHNLVRVVAHETHYRSSILPVSDQKIVQKQYAWKMFNVVTELEVARRLTDRPAFPHLMSEREKQLRAGRVIELGRIKKALSNDITALPVKDEFTSTYTQLVDFAVTLDPSRYGSLKS